MTRDQLIGRLSVASGIVIGIVVLVTAGLIALPGLRRAVAPGPQLRSGYQIGQRVDLAPALYSDHPRTAVFIVRHDCAACVSAQPTLASYVDHLQAQKVPVLVVADNRDPAAEAIYARRLGVEQNALVVLDLASLDATYVPSILVVDASGVVRFVRAGSVAELEREPVLRSILEAVRQ
jgi:hypothetical protein